MRQTKTQTRLRSRWHAIANLYAFTTKQEEVKNKVGMPLPRGEFM